MGIRLTGTIAAAVLVCDLSGHVAQAQQGDRGRQTFAQALSQLSLDDLEAWLQANVAGLVTYEAASESADSTPGQRDIDFSSTIFRRYTWSNCQLVVEEGWLEGVWLKEQALETTAVVDMKDVGGVGSAGMTQGEGNVALDLLESATSKGNVQRGRTVRILTRYPKVATKILAVYSAECKVRR